MITRLDAQYDFNDDSTIFDLGSDLKAVAISGMGVASIRLCYMLQQLYPLSLHVIDEAYCFDLVVSDFRNAEELGAAMLMAQNGAVEPPAT